MSPDAFAAEAGVSRETLGRFETYAELLRHWQTRINLVSRATLDDLWRRHFLDSAQLLPLIPPGAQTLVDLGSGAGFPGLVLALLGVPEVTLIEADQRKSAFLTECARRIGVRVQVRTARIEAVPPSRADVITARALAPLDRLVELAARFGGPGTVSLFLKGQDVEAELTTLPRDSRVRVERWPSRTNPDATVLRLTELPSVEPDVA
ncbi:MAG: 16S rRNA (guanine(527)-N(7))-methyltransferase RsmG [Rhodospirillaceae bacterium]|nr:16S rRNA (guanine(527)-N(7))-methyltransferase RsmG [Rhodospirillaceae bacterium]